MPWLFPRPGTSRVIAGHRFVNESRPQIRSLCRFDLLMRV